MIILPELSDEKNLFVRQVMGIVAEIKKGRESNFSPLSVRLIGLEPTRIATPDPKSGASTNFATSATIYR